MDQSLMPARRGRAAAALLLLAALVLALLAATGGRAYAHAALVAAEPADGSVVATAPASFVLRFSEPVSPLVLKLIGPDGTAILLDRYALRDTTLDIAAPDVIGEGTHVLSWRVVSEDGHPVGGATVFSIGAPTSDGGPVAEAVDQPLRIAIWLARTLVYASLFLGVGGAFFIRMVGGAGASIHCARAALLLGLVAAPLSVGLLGLDAIGLPLAAIAAPQAWQAGWATSYGTTAVTAGVALAGALLALSITGLTARILATAALTGTGLALAASGHASTAPPHWLMRTAVCLHGIGIAFWAGALVPLGMALAAPSPASRRTLRRFSRAIPFAVLPLLATGLLLAFVQMQRPDALWTTDYGRVLAVKLVLVALLFGLAALNRFRLTEPAEEGDAEATRRLRRSIAAELVLVVAIFAVAALWRFTPPPRALAEAAAMPASVHIHTADAMADLSLTPGHAGRVAAAITILAGDFGPLDAKELTLVLANPDAGIEPIRRRAALGTDGVWRIESLDLPLSGRWQVRLDILIDDFTLVKLEDALDIRP